MRLSHIAGALVVAAFRLRASAGDAGVHAADQRPDRGADGDAGEVHIRARVKLKRFSGSSFAPVNPGPFSRPEPATDDFESHCEFGVFDGGHFYKPLRTGTGRNAPATTNKVGLGVVGVQAAPRADGGSIK